VLSPMSGPRSPRWLLGFLSCCLLSAFASGAEDGLPLTGFVVTKWVQKDGLPGSDVRRIVQTRDGYLWLSTDAGLIRFDGVRFVSVPTVSETPAPATGGLLAVSDGSLWVGLARGGVVHIQNQSAIYYSPNNTLTGGQVRVIAEDHSGAIWVGTSSGLSRFAENKWYTFGTQDGFPGQRVGEILEDQAGVIRIASDLGVFRWEANSNRFVSEKEAPNYTGSLSRDAGGTIWITDEVHGLHPLHAKDRDIIRWKAGVSIFEDHRHDIWIRSYADGLRRLSSRGRRERFTVREGLSNDFVECVFEDREGNIWIGTQNGLNRLRPTNFVPVRDQNIVNGFARDIAVTGDGSLWAIVNPHIFRLRDESAAVYSTPSHFQGTVFSADGAAPLVLGSTRYLAELRRNRFVSLLLPEDAPLSLISDVARDPAGGLWIADYKAGLVRWSGGRLVQFPQFLKKNVRRLLVDQQCRVWVGAGDGLWRKEQESWRHFTKADGIAEGTIRVLYLGRNGTVWIATADGITRFRDEQFVSFFPKLPPGGITSMVEDDIGSIWLVHSAGIFRIAAGEWERASRDSGYEMQYRKFDEDDGLPAPPPAIQGHFAAKASGGKLWFALRSGVASIDPANMEENRIPPPVAIEEGVADHHSLRPAASLRLPPHTRSLEIAYTALSLTAPERVKFKVKLEGFDNDWIDPGKLRRVFYTNLPPGNYRFRVMASNNDGIWNQSGAVWEFSVAPAFYQTRLFLIVCAVAGTGLLWGAHRLRIRQLDSRNRAAIEERVAERIRVARELHDTLLQNIAGLSLEIHGLSKTVAPSSLKEELEGLRRQAEACVREARQSVWDLRSTKNGHADLATRLQELGDRLTLGKSVRFALCIQGEPRPLPADVEQQILRIGQEAITNSVRHARATRVQAHLGFAGNLVRLRVSDNGRGFDLHEAALCKGRWGLVTMRERAQQIGAEFKIVSGMNRGTEIETTVPALGV